MNSRSRKKFAQFPSGGDYIRHGTTTLFAALEYATGKVVHAHHQTHTHKEWLSFLKQIWCTAPKDVSIEIVADNYQKPLFGFSESSSPAARLQAWMSLSAPSEMNLRFPVAGSMGLSS